MPKSQESTTLIHTSKGGRVMGKKYNEDQERNVALYTLHKLDPHTYTAYLLAKIFQRDRKTVYDIIKRLRILDEAGELSGNSFLSE